MSRAGLSRGYAWMDRATRGWWRLVGRPIDPDGEHRWLSAPMSSGAEVGDHWISAAAGELGAHVPEPRGDDGLLDSLDRLDGPDFRADDVAAEVRDFYEHTASWRIDAWSEWSPLLAPGGAVVETLFGRRISQLALPVRPLEVSHGIDSQIRRFVDPDLPEGRAQLGAAWLRRVRRTGRYLFSGFYRVATMPGAQQPSVHVSFPLEQGSVQVFLRPEAGSDGSLVLHSPPGEFGDPGAYVVARSGGRTWASRIPIHEEFRVWVDPDGFLRTDHHLDLGRIRALHLHYRMERIGSPS